MKGWGNRQGGGGKGLKCKEKNDHHVQFAIQCLFERPCTGLEWCCDRGKALRGPKSTLKGGRLNRGQIEILIKKNLSPEGAKRKVSHLHLTITFISLNRPLRLRGKRLLGGLPMYEGPGRPRQICTSCVLRILSSGHMRISPFRSTSLLKIRPILSIWQHVLSDGDRPRLRGKDIRPSAPAFPAHTQLNEPLFTTPDLYAATVRISSIQIFHCIIPDV